MQLSRIVRLSGLLSLNAFFLQSQAQVSQPPAGTDISAEQNPAAPDLETVPKLLPVEVSGYFSFRQMRGEDPSRPAFREYAGSLFLSKAYKHWNFHSEFNAEHSADFDGDGILIGPRSAGAHLHTAWLNYSYRDWLNGRGGLVHIPTYWRTHRYQSITLTVEEPLIDQRVFPSALAGGMVHGSSYFGDSGFTYTLYGGGGLLGGRGFENKSLVHSEEGLSSEAMTTGSDTVAPQLIDSRAAGGTFVYHFPSRQFFQHLDFGAHRLEIAYAGRIRQSVYGFELQVEKKRLSFLGEYAHAAIAVPDGSQHPFRQGYYLQPSWRITPKLFGVYRFDSFDAGNGSEFTMRAGRHTAGVTYRPLATVSLKLEYVRHRFEGIDSDFFHNGVSVGAVYYFLFR